MQDTRDKITVFTGKKEFTIFLTRLNALLYVIRRQIWQQFAHFIAPDSYPADPAQSWGLDQQLKKENEKYYRKDKPIIQKELDRFIESIDKEWQMARRKEFLINQINILKKITYNIKKGFNRLKEIKAPTWLINIYDEMNPYDIHDRKINRYENELYMVQNQVTSELIEQVKEISVKELIGVPTKRIGELEWASCPFHEDKTPSLAIYPGTGGWYCYGCGEGGSTIDFIMKQNRMTFIQAVNYLKPYV